MNAKDQQPLTGIPLDIQDKGKRSRWRKTRLSDVLIAGTGEVLFIVFLVYRFFVAQDLTHLLVGVGFWAFMTALQTRTFIIVLQKYRDGEDIRSGFFVDMTERRKKNA